MTLAMPSMLLTADAVGYEAGADGAAVEVELLAVELHTARFGCRLELKNGGRCRSDAEHECGKQLHCVKALCEERSEVVSFGSSEWISIGYDFNSFRYFLR